MISQIQTTIPNFNQSFMSLVVTMEGSDLYKSQQIEDGLLKKSVSWQASWSKDLVLADESAATMGKKQSSHQ